VEVATQVAQTAEEAVIQAAEMKVEAAAEMKVEAAKLLFIPLKFIKYNIPC
jgi:hypothetical protein